MSIKPLDIKFWALRCHRGWLQNKKRVVWEDNKPGHGIVLFKSRRDAKEYAAHFYPDERFVAKRVRLVSV